MDTERPQQPGHARLGDWTPTRPVGPGAVFEGDQPADQFGGGDGLVRQDLPDVRQQPDRDGVIAHRLGPGQARGGATRPRGPVAAGEIGNGDERFPHIGGPVGERTRQRWLGVA